VPHRRSPREQEIGKGIGLSVGHASNLSSPRRRGPMSHFAFSEMPRRVMANHRVRRVLRLKEEVGAFR
jgi:hypothetical protein